ncbi:MAG: Rhomboid protease GlpG [Candidatus Hydrogenedentes bacterium ADurb.Bin179]|nr:MAG: Rhomboid protease GlpG [Candidatus Hydrogenedentes bacterium ADurb.Bin179]
MEKVSGGQVWRLFTPVFLHYSLWHLLINLLWLQELGGVLETRLGTRHVLVLMGLLAMVSNLAQYAVVGADQFMGMNGVVYGMLGYYWARQRLDGWNTPVISPVTYGVLLVFLGLGVFGLMGPAANAAHFSGLLAGAGTGWVVSKNGR